MLRSHRVLEKVVPLFAVEPPEARKGRSSLAVEPHDDEKVVSAHRKQETT
jgi:hypothetical protein